MRGAVRHCCALYRRAAAGVKRKGRPQCMGAPLLSHADGRLAGVTAAIVLVAVVAAVAVTIDRVAVATPVLVVAAPVIDVTTQAHLEPGDATLDFHPVTAAEAVAGQRVDAAIEIARFFAKTGRFTVRDDVATVELADLATDLVDPRFEATDLAMIVIAIGIPLRNGASLTARWRGPRRLASRWQERR